MGQTSSGLRVTISSADLRWTSASRSRFFGNRLRPAWTNVFDAWASCHRRAARSAASQPRRNSGVVRESVMPRCSPDADRRPPVPSQAQWCRFAQALSAASRHIYRGEIVTSLSGSDKQLRGVLQRMAWDRRVPVLRASSVMIATDSEHPDQKCDNAHRSCRDHRCSTNARGMPLQELRHQVGPIEKTQLCRFEIAGVQHGRQMDLEFAVVPHDRIRPRKLSRRLWS